MTGVLERLDALEAENKTLRADVDALKTAAPGPTAPFVPPAADPQIAVLAKSIATIESVLGIDDSGAELGATAEVQATAHDPETGEPIAGSPVVVGTGPHELSAPIDPGTMAPAEAPQSAASADAPLVATDSASGPAAPAAADAAAGAAGMFASADASTAG